MLFFDFSSHTVYRALNFSPRHLCIVSRGDYSTFCDRGSFLSQTWVFGGTGKWLFPLPSCLGVAVTHSRLITDELRKKRRWRRGGRGGDTALSCGFFKLCFSSCNKMCQRCDDHVLGNIITKNVAIFQIHDSIWFIVFFWALAVMLSLALHLDL